MIKTYQINWPLQMSPIAGTNFVLGLHVKFKPGFQNPGWKNRARRSREPKQPTLSYEHIMNLEVNKRDHGNGAHVRRPYAQL